VLFIVPSITRGVIAGACRKMACEDREALGETFIITCPESPVSKEQVPVPHIHPHPQNETLKGSIHLLVGLSSETGNPSGCFNAQLMAEVLYQKGT
jgi:hypothetical protein